MTANGRCWRSACRSLFGLDSHPSIAGGTVPLTLELLVARAPADPDDARPAGLLAWLLGRRPRRHARPLSQTCLARRSARSQRDSPRETAREIEQFQQKCAAVLRPELRGNNLRADHEPSRYDRMTMVLNTPRSRPEPEAAAQYAGAAALARHRRPERHRGHRRLRARLPAAGRALFRADRLLGGAERLPCAAIPIDAPRSRRSPPSASSPSTRCSLPACST